MLSLCLAARAALLSLGGALPVRCSPSLSKMRPAPGWLSSSDILSSSCLLLDLKTGKKEKNDPHLEF